MSKQDGKLQQLEDKIKWGCDIARPDSLTNKSDQGVGCEIQFDEDVGYE